MPEKPKRVQVHEPWHTAIGRERVLYTSTSENRPSIQVSGAKHLANFAAELVKVEQADSATARPRRREQAKGIVKLFVSSPSVAPVGGTRWAAYQAVSEWTDHVLSAAVMEQAAIYAGCG